MTLKSAKNTGIRTQKDGRDGLTRHRGLIRPRDLTRTRGLLVIFMILAAAVSSPFASQCQARSGGSHCSQTATAAYGSATIATGFSLFDSFFSASGGFENAGWVFGVIQEGGALSEAPAAGNGNAAAGNGNAAAGQAKPGPAAGQNAPPPQDPFGGWIMMLMPIVLVIFLMMAMRPQQKDQKKRDQMLKEIKKNDRVLTAGGILAKVASIKQENKTVKLILDENTGSTMTVRLSAIVSVLTGDEKLEEIEG